MYRPLLVLSLAAVLASCQPEPQPRRISITIDDAPIAKPLSYESDWERTLTVDSLTGALARHGVTATVFAIASDFDRQESRVLLPHWTDAGHLVSNHSLNHRSFNELSGREGVQEIAQAQAVLSRLVPAANASRYFRFPFLEEGQALVERERWLGVLDSLALTRAPVTITTDDWRFDNDYTAAEEAQDWAARYDIGQAYLQHVKESIQHWDGVATDLYGRNVRHVLMLHANRVNRDYLGAILDWLEAEGFEFVTLDEALQDELFDEDIGWVGVSGVSILEQIKQTRMLSAR